MIRDSSRGYVNALLVQCILNLELRVHIPFLWVTYTLDPVVFAIKFYPRLLYKFRVDEALLRVRSVDTEWNIGTVPGRITSLIYISFNQQEQFLVYYLLQKRTGPK
jgi:hypothetical protein